MGNSRTDLSEKQLSMRQHPAPERREHSGGFTLIELMLAVAIIGIMSSLAIPNYVGFLEKARMAKTVAEMNGIAKQIQLYSVAEGQYPDSLGQIGLDNLRDQWGNPYQYLRINCMTQLSEMRDNSDPSHTGSEGLVLPVSVVLSPITAHVSLAVNVGNLQGRMYLVAQGGNGNGGGGNGNGGGGNGNGGGGNGNGNGGGGCGSGQPRKDHFLHPINSDFDLYSMGKDGDSVAPLTAQKSRDDIIRANDGGYYGVASNF
ncbi:MAG: prepilin-type N-terminal cleavage/methylation domain-containing protein [Nitrospira sp.]|nr:MAG: prepilin-type N-terminal cleavage/methylation domain-containing protein [Nitrospira sp.]